MAFDLKVENGVVRVTFEGYLDSKDLERLDEIVSGMEAEYDVSPDRISDLSSIEGVHLDCAAMEFFADRRRHAPLKNRVKSAIVVPRPLQYGIARMFQTLNDNPNINSQIFTDRERALNWLATGKGSGADAAPMKVEESSPE